MFKGGNSNGPRLITYMYFLMIVPAPPCAQLCYVLALGQYHTAIKSTLGANLSQ